MERLFNDNWTFLKTALGTELNDLVKRKEEFVPVDLPHDWLIYDTNALYEDGCGWYRKIMNFKGTNEENAHVFLCFDGVYMDSTVYINGIKIGDWKYGYSSFSFEIGKALVEGENKILVQVRHQSPNSRWYSGAGIYRNVTLRICGEDYLVQNGTYVSSTYISEHTYQIELETEVIGQGNLACAYSLWKDGELVADLGSAKEYRVKDGMRIYTHNQTLNHVKEWDVESPNVYRLQVELRRNDEICEGAIDQSALVDQDEINVGFKRVEYKPESGFWLNGRRLKLNGVCEHHDLGCLGSAFHKEAMARKFRILRGMGVNALRTSHNMPAKEVMDLADEMGFLVVSEAFDMWERSKTDYDYARFFKEWAKVDVASWIRRDRNHPSLIMWSIGNEIYDTHADEAGQEITKRLRDYVLQHDPKGNGRITIGSNYMPWEGAQKCADILKIAGYNYGEKCYAEHHEAHKDWVIYGSETGSLVQSRGVYRFPLEQSVLSDEDEQCSGLGNSATSWGARSAEKCITDDRDAKFSMGQFVWTGFDYIGEPTPYHTKNSYFGHVDTAGFPKDSYYLYGAEWLGKDAAPFVHVYPYWDYNEGQLVDVRACTNGASVELLVNGKSYGLQRIDHEKGLTLQGHWKVPYEEGEITAVAFDENGKEVSRQTRCSFGDAVALVLETDKTSFKGDGEDLVFVSISTVDRKGCPVENAMNYVEVLVKGAARLLGMDNGDSTDYDPYKTNVRKLFNGKLLAVIGSNGNSGEVEIQVNSPGLESASLKLTATPCVMREGISCTEDVMNHPAHLTGRVPARRVKIQALEGTILTADKPSVLVEASVYPMNATERHLEWKAVNRAGVEIPHVQIKVEGNVETQSGYREKARITAHGDGDFVLRCQALDDKGHVRVISQLEFRAEEIGVSMLNPYKFISAGLFTKTLGEIGNGNEKGIATAREGRSGVFFEGVDMGDFGSDEVTIPIFALSGEPYDVELWLGVPGEEGSELLTRSIYQKPSIWNVYQEETFFLPRRIKGVVTFGIVMEQKVHVKGFSFTRYEKAFSKLAAGECDAIYGDSFRKEGKEILGIGNNVTMVFEGMDFGEKGVSGVVLRSRSALAGNTIHLQFVDESGNSERRILEIPGAAEYQDVEIDFEPVYGKRRVEFVFLPGCQLDMESFCFKA